MQSIIEAQLCVNEDTDLPCPSSYQRRYTQLSRILQLIDVMAAYTRFHSSLEIQAELNDRFGTSWTYKTVRRDLQFLFDFGLLERQFKAEHFDGRKSVPIWRLNMKASETLQESAFSFIEGNQLGATA